jgi:MFS family permease
MVSTLSPEPAGTAAAVQPRAFTYLLIAYTTSALGAAMIPIALSYGLLNAGRSVADVSLVMSAQSLTYAIAILPAGVLADRLARRNIMIAADLLRCFSQIAMAMLIVRADTPILLLGLLAAQLGLGSAMHQPSVGGLLPQIVPTDRIQQATSLLSVSLALSGVMGPLLAGALIAAGGAALVFGADAASYAFSAALLCMIRPLPRTAREKPFLANFAEGWRAFMTRRWLVAIMSLFGALNLLALPPLLVLGAARFHERGFSALDLGAVMASVGIGAVLGGMIAMRVQFRRSLVAAVAATLATAPVLVLVALDAPFFALLIGGALFGVGMAGANIAIQTSVQRSIPGDRISRVLSICQLVAVATAPIGFGLASPAAAWIGAQQWLLVSAGVIVVACAAVLGVPDVRRFSVGAASTENAT